MFYFPLWIYIYIYYNVLYIIHIYESALSSNNYAPPYILKIIKSQLSDIAFIVVK